MHGHRPECTAAPSTEVLFLDVPALRLFNDPLPDELVRVVHGDLICGIA